MRSWETATAVPAARSDGLLIEPVGDEIVVYDTQSKQAHCLKPLAAIVFECSDGRATVRDMAKVAEDRLGQGVSEAEVADAVAQLESLGLLQIPLVVLPGTAGNGNGLSRREMLRRVGFAGAAAATATTLVTSIVAPTPAFAASGIPPGCPGCNKNPDCTSSHCCQPGAPGKQCGQGCCVLGNNSCHLSSCTCVGGTRDGLDCLTQTCPGGTCICNCTVCLSQNGGSCPTNCPGGLPACCVTTC
jgi:hypothetical protein